MVALNKNITSNYKYVSAHKEVVGPLTAMIDAAKNQGVSLKVLSGYRSKKRQSEIINDKKRTIKNLKTIYTASAPSGYSEHHTGFAFDFNSLNQSFGSTKAYRWLQENAHQYGFKLTYKYSHKKDGVAMAANGTKWEPWHWSYVGSLTARNALVNANCP